MGAIIRKVKRNFWLYQSCLFILNSVRRIKGMGGVKIDNLGTGRLCVDSYGTGNIIKIGKDSSLQKVRVRIRGNGNVLEINDNCKIGPKCSFWMEGNDIKIHVSRNTTFTHSVHFCAQENGTKIIVGEDCMFSNTITVRTSDSHPIYDIATNDRLNQAKSIKIGSHVWIAPNSKIMKGANIGDGAVVGSNSMVTKDVPANTLAVGMPARVVKEGIKWTREKLF